VGRQHAFSREGLRFSNLIPLGEVSYGKEDHKH